MAGLLKWLLQGLGVRRLAVGAPASNVELSCLDLGLGPTFHAKFQPSGANLWTITAAQMTVDPLLSLNGGFTLAGGAFDISAGSSFTWATNSIPHAALSNGTGFSLIGRAEETAGANADIVASVGQSVLYFSGSTLSFAKMPVAAINTIGTAGSQTVLRGDGAWSNSVSGSWTVGTNFTLNSGTFTVPSNVIARAALVSTPGLSVLGKASSGSGAVGDIVALADGQYLKRSGGALSFAAPTLAELPNAGLSVLARTANSSGVRTNLAPATTTGGDEMFVEAAALVFDSYIRKRRNIMQGFWEFEAGATGYTASGQPLPGTPFIGFTTGVSAISGANRATVLTRNCLTLICAGIGRAAFTMGDAAPVGAPGLTTGIGPLICEVGLNINMLSTAPEEHTFNVGFVCDDAIGDDGVFFQYQRSSTPNWRLVARSGGTTTVTNTTTAVAVAGVRLRIEITTASLATFYINGTSVGTVTSNIPVRVGLGAVLDKSVHAAATVFHDIDYIAYQLALTTPRSATQM